MLYKGILGDEYSGAVGGLVMSHGAGGYYCRTRVVPTNPATPYQVAVRTSLSNLSAQWKVLSDAQRAAWAAYALATPLLNRIGDTRPIPALAMFVRCNVPRLQAGIPSIDSGPTTPGLVSLLPVAFDTGSFVAGPPSTADVTFTAGDAWNVAGGGLLLYASRPQSTTINFWKGPYQFAGFVDGTGPGVSPFTVTLPFPVVVGQRVFMRAVATDADGRLSASQTFQFDAA